MKDVSYLDSVKATMNLSTTAGVSEKDKNTSRVMLHCPACLEDDTFGAAWKENLWRKDILKRHVFTKSHSPFIKLKREIEAKYDQNPNLGYQCPYCRKVEAFIEDSDITSRTSFNRFSRMDNVIKHIKDSTSTAIAGAK